MSFYDDASLVVIPSGYKTSKVYSVKPTDGTGDLTFTRSNDTASRIAPNGLIEKVRTNLILQSQTLDNASWTKSASSVTANTTTAPDGTSTADTWTADGTAATHGIIQSGTATLTNGTTYSTSIYAKKGTNDFIQIIGSSSPYGSLNVFANFDLNNGVVGTVGSLVTATIQDAGNGWYRCTMIAAAAATTSTNTFIVQIVSSASAARGESNSLATSVFLWGAQLEVSDFGATSYIPTTSAAVSVGPVANVPRLDYLNSSCPRLLLEPQRQNVCLWSEQIDNAGWAKTNSPTITTNIATAPDGYGGADGIQDTTGGTFKRINQNFTVSANSTVTASVFVKKETSETNYGGMALLFTGGTTNVVYSIVDAVNGTATLSTGTIGSASTKIEDYGTYYRVTLTATDSGSNTSVGFSYYGTLSVNGTTVGTSAGSVRTVWGFQVEIGASYSSSYIPTLGAAVTRGADDFTKTGISSLIGQTEGTLFVDFIPANTPVSGVQQWIFFLGSGVTYIGFLITSGGKLRGNVANTTDQAVIDTSYNLVSGTTYKAALAYKQDDFALYVNGVQIGLDTSGTVPAVSSLRANYNTTAANMVNAKYNQALVFQTRLSNADLAALTTI